jgi:hypothetical protein
MRRNAPDAIAALRRSATDRSTLRRVPRLRFAHAAQLPALRALLTDGRPLPHDDTTSAAAAYHRLEGYAVRADPASPLLAAHRQGALSSALVRAQLSTCAPAVTAVDGSPPVLVKGPAAAALHPSPELRPFGDLDLVVPKPALRPAAAALQAAGWRLSRAPRMGVAGGEPWPGFAESYGHELGLALDVGAKVVGVELHWRLVDDPRADALDRDVLASGGQMLDGAIVPAVPQLLVALALHLVAHPDRRLIMVQDVALAARAAGSELPRAFALADELRVGWELRLALDAAQEHAGLAIEWPGPRPRKPPLGPLRAALWPVPRPVAVHLGRLAALDGRGRLRYIAAGLRSLRPRARR